MRMDRRLWIGALAGFAMMAGSAGADGPRYNYFDAKYAEVSIDGLDADVLGYEVGFSAGIAESFHIFGGYEDLDLDLLDFGVLVGLEGSNAKLTLWDVGIGWHGGLGDRADFVGEVAYADVDIELLGVSQGGSGYAVRAGVRSMVTDKIELNGFAVYTDFGDAGDDTAVEGGAVFYIGQIFGIIARYSVGEDMDEWQVGGRFHFGSK